ncbi:MAG: hypothetical protein OEZ33_08665 [Gammaproteobacteria bacterium]|nr:hypothetical protein [Gammaproteobacteria bacterium]MDH5778270.1 hypothetical protein [Gammaproteobacteria bacterium]
MSIGIVFLVFEVFQNNPAPFGVVITGVSNAIVGSLFIIKGMMWGKVCLVRNHKHYKRIDYSGVGISVLTFIIASKVYQTGVLKSRGIWVYLGEERYLFGTLLMAAGLYMLFHAIECVWHR